MENSSSQTSSTNKAELSQATSRALLQRNQKLNARSTAGRDLLLELKRGQAAANTKAASAGVTLPPYNLNLVEQCLEDLDSSVQQLALEVQAASQTNDDTGKSQKPNMAARPSILWHHACIQRNKRCLLAYHSQRLQAIRQHVQEPSNASSNQTFSLTNAAELDFAESYRQLRRQYEESMSTDFWALDLGALPPTTHSIQVRCLVELGDVVLESGRSVSFTKGSVWYLPRSDVLEYLQEGSLQVLEGEEVDF